LETVVATPNNDQNTSLSFVLDWSISPDSKGDKWILHYLTYNLNEADHNIVESIFVVFVDSFSKKYQCYDIDLNGKIIGSKFDV
jgi:hypothetical protein